MGNTIEFFVDGKPFAADSPQLTAGEIMKIAGANSDYLYLVSETTGEKYFDTSSRIKIQQGEKFVTLKRDDVRPVVPSIIRYKVNGEEQTTTDNPITLEAILRKAGTAAAVDVAELEHYYLENVVDGRKYDNLDDLITIEDGDQFLAIHAGATPVA